MKTTSTLGLKLYDPTDAPDLVSGYNASMATLDGSRILCFKRPLGETDDLNDVHDTGYYNDAANTIPANAAPGLIRPVRYIVLDACTSPGRGECTTQIAVGTPVVGKDNMLVRNYHANTGWTEWLPVSAEQASSWAKVTGKPFETIGKTLTTRDDTLDLSTAAQASLVPAGGAAGQVLVKNSDTDHDCEWMNPSALTNVLSLDSTYGLQQGDTPVPALQVRTSNESMVAMNASTQTVQCQQERNVYGALTSSGLTMRNDGGTTSYTVGANGKGILNNITMINGDLPLKVGEEFKLKSNVIGADYKAMSAAFGFDGFNPAIGMGVLRLGSQGVQATCAVRVEASLVGSNLFTIYAVVFEPFINKNVTGFYMGGSATTTSTVDSNIDWGDSIYLTPLTKLKA